MAYEYNTQGLVTAVKSIQTGFFLARFYYDDGGFRYKKENFDEDGDVHKTTLYVRDLSGQITAIYSEDSDIYTQEELAFYGNSRIGTIALGDESSPEDDYLYELKDHLGNVRQVIKVTEGTKDWAYVKSNYYPFGMKFMNVNSYRYGYQGDYSEDETEENGIKANSFQLRLYNPRLGRWMSPDPYGQFHSPYLAMGNTPIIGIDPNGGICPTCPNNGKWDHLINSELSFTYNNGVATRSEALDEVTLTVKRTGKTLGDRTEAPLIDFSAVLDRIGQNINDLKQSIDISIRKIADGDFMLLADIGFSGYGGYMVESYGPLPEDNSTVEEKIGDGVTFAIPFLVTRKIGRGHAYKKHVVKQKEFPKVKSKEQLVNIVDKVTSSVHSQHKVLSNGREAWYRKADNTLVIYNPNHPDKGTVFRPTAGETYFNNLK